MEIPSFDLVDNLKLYEPIQVDQKLVWFDDKRHRAIIETFPSVVFKFEIWTTQMLQIQVEGDVLAAGKRTVHGTMGFVTKETSNLLGTPFLAFIYDLSHKKVAEIHNAMFTEYTQEYSLDNQHIFEARFYAAHMELKHD